MTELKRATEIVLLRRRTIREAAISLVSLCSTRERFPFNDDNNEEEEEECNLATRYPLSPMFAAFNTPNRGSKVSNTHVGEPFKFFSCDGLKRSFKHK